MEEPSAALRESYRPDHATGRKKRVYDTPRTPYQRLLDADVLDEKNRTRLKREHATLNPARITRRINHIQQQLINLATARTQGTRPTARATRTFPREANINPSRTS